MTAALCRCGFTGVGPHPCHGTKDGKRYGCRKPAQQRFYAASLVPLSGQTLKVGADETWACDDCWDAFRKYVPLLKALPQT